MKILDRHKSKVDCSVYSEQTGFRGRDFLIYKGNHFVIEGNT